MASVLKRKRGAVEVQDTPKRAKSTKKPAKNPAQKVEKNVGWEAALEDMPKTNELIKANGANQLKNEHTMTTLSPESMDLDIQKSEDVKTPEARGEVAAGTPIEKASLWKLSESIAGRMSNLEPVFTADEK
jgi:NET1-associated nuclear protein 1 (U3 small nucleolar RNA-associated protein 17)